MSLNNKVINKIISEFNLNKNIESYQKIKDLVSKNNKNTNLIFAYGLMSLQLNKRYAITCSVLVLRPQDYQSLPSSSEV